MCPLEKRRRGRFYSPPSFGSDNPPTAIATFEDADLEAAVRTALSVSAREDLTCGLVSGLNSRDLINVQPLLINPGLGAGDEVDLRFTWVSCSDVAALEGKGVTILRVTSPGPPACQ